MGSLKMNYLFAFILLSIQGFGVEPLHTYLYPEDPSPDISRLEVTPCLREQVLSFPEGRVSFNGILYETGQEVVLFLVNIGECYNYDWYMNGQFVGSGKRVVIFIPPYVTHIDVQSFECGCVPLS